MSDATNANDPLAGCNVQQRKWVIARLVCSSDAEAARQVGVDKTTVCRWPNKAQLDAAVAMMLAAPMQHARAILEDAIPEAARVKIAGLKSRNEFVRQGAASDVLDRGLGKATQRQEISGANGGPLELIVVEQIVSADDSTAPDASGVSPQ